jgi:hypothetical protein
MSCFVEASFQAAKKWILSKKKAPFSFQHSDSDKGSRGQDQIKDGFSWNSAGRIAKAL